MAAVPSFPGVLPEANTQWFEALIGKVDTHRLQGRLVHPNGDPCRNQKVTVLMKGWVWNAPIGNFTTNMQGRFSFNYECQRSFLTSSHKLQFQIAEMAPPKEPFIDHILPDRVLSTVAVMKQTLPLSHDAGDVTASFFEYQKGFPMLQQPGSLLEAPEEDSFYFLQNLLRAVAKPIAIQTIVRIAKGLLTTGAVQRAYGSVNPNLRLSGETTIDMLLNGVYPWYFLKGKNSSELILDINWDQYVVKAAPDLPNAKLTVHQDSNTGKLSVTEVVIKFRDEEPLVCSPDHPDYMRALYLFNSAALVRGEMVTHLGMGHLWSGQASMAVYRNLRNNPLRNLLFPHLAGVHRIDHLGVGLIFGKNGILAKSGLSFESILPALKDVLGGMCYTSFKPRAPLNEDHRFAKAELLYWDIVSKSVDNFFAENEEGIRNNWQEIYSLSKNLVENSVIYKPLDGVTDRNQWVDANEIDDPSVPGRVIVDGELKSVRPITLKEDTDPTSDDMERLKQFSRHAIFMATFWHWAVHTSQGEWGTNLEWASLAPRGHAKGPYGGTTPGDANELLALGMALTNFDGNHLLENPFGNIYPDLIARLAESRAAFARLDYDINNLHFGTVI